MEKSYFLKYIGTEPIRTLTKEGKRYVEPQEVFETDIRNFKNLTGIYPRLFKEVELVVQATDAVVTKTARVKDIAPEVEQPESDQENEDADENSGEDGAQNDETSDEDKQTADEPPSDDKTEGENVDSKVGTRSNDKQESKKVGKKSK